SDLTVRFPPLAGARGWNPNKIFRFQRLGANLGLSGVPSSVYRWEMPYSFLASHTLTTTLPTVFPV
ncbi:MAG: hypothetical protein KDC75_25220, partial [Phaeodactylibacter sp.]|nr:hypothetical protein [Phaeodactylibacter sp.]